MFIFLSLEVEATLPQKRAEHARSAAPRQCRIVQSRRGFMLNAQAARRPPSTEPARRWLFRPLEKLLDQHFLDELCTHNVIRGPEQPGLEIRLVDMAADADAILKIAVEIAEERVVERHPLRLDIALRHAVVEL